MLNFLVFVWIAAFHPSQQFFSNVGMFPGLNTVLSKQRKTYVSLLKDTMQCLR